MLAGLQKRLHEDVCARLVAFVSQFKRSNAVFEPRAWAGSAQVAVKQDSEDHLTRHELTGGERCLEQQRAVGPCTRLSTLNLFAVIGYSQASVGTRTLRSLLQWQKYQQEYIPSSSV